MNWRQRLLNAELLISFVCLVCVRSFPAEPQPTVTDNSPTDEEIATFKVSNQTEAVANADKDDTGGCIADDKASSSQLTRNGIAHPDKKWRRFKYFVEPGFTESERRMLKIAFAMLRDVLPCVSFEELDAPLPTDVSHVLIRHSETRCHSDIGRQGDQQVIRYRSVCMETLRPIMHQICHALGLHHEWNRPDRDDYVNVHWSNIVEDHKHLFEKPLETEFYPHGVTYNRWSIMHYTDTAASYRVDETKPILSSKKDAKFAPYEPLKFGPYPSGLQRTDVVKLTRMYGAPGDCHV